MSFAVDSPLKKENKRKWQTGSVYQPDLSILYGQLSKSRETSIKPSKTRIQFQTITDRTLSQQKLENPVLENIGLLGLITASDADANDRDKILRRVRDQYLDGYTAPSGFLSTPTVNWNYIQQYTVVMVEKERARKLWLAKIKKVALKVAIFTAITGVPVLVSGSLVVSPTWVLPLLQGFLPESWVKAIDSNKVPILYHCMFTVMPLVSDPSIHLLNTVAGNLSVRNTILSTVQDIGIGLVGSPTIAMVFSNLVYSNISQMATSSKKFVLAAQEDQDIRQDLLKKVYEANLAEEREMNEILGLLKQGHSAQEIQKLLAKRASKTSVAAKCFYHLARGLKFAGKKLYQNKVYVLTLCLLGGFMWYVGPQMLSAFMGLLPGIFGMATKLISVLVDGIHTLGASAGFFGTQEISLWGAIQMLNQGLNFLVGYIKTLVPPSAISAQLTQYALNWIVPWFTGYVLNAICLPHYLDHFLKRFPSLNQNIDNIAAVRWIQESLGAWYGKQIEWNITGRELIKTWFLQNTARTVSLSVIEMVPKTLLEGLVSKLDFNTVWFFIGGGYHAASQLATPITSLGHSGVDWNVFTIQNLFPQFVTSMSWILPGTKLYNELGVLQNEVVGFDHFILELLDGTKVDLTSNAAFFDNLRIKDDTPGGSTSGSLQTIPAEIATRTAVQAMLSVITKSDTKPGQVDLSKVNLGEFFKDDAGILLTLTNNGVDVDKVSVQIKETLAEIYESTNIPQEYQIRVKTSQGLLQRLISEQAKFLNYKEKGQTSLILLESGLDPDHLPQATSHTILTTLGQEIKIKQQQLDHLQNWIKEQSTSRDNMIRGLDERVERWLRGSVAGIKKQSRGIATAGLQTQAPNLDLGTIRSETKSVSQKREIGLETMEKDRSKLDTKLFNQRQQVATRVQNVQRTKESVAQKMNQVLLQSGVDNAVRFATGNAFAVDLVMIQSLLQKFADSALVPSLFPDGLEDLEKIDQFANDLQQRNAKAQEFFNQNAGDKAALCVNADSYQWSLEHGKPLNLLTGQLDESLSPCFADAGVGAAFKVINKTGEFTASGVKLGGAFGIAASAVINIAMAAAKVTPIFYGRVLGQTTAGGEKDSVTEAVHLLSDITCIADPTSNPCIGYKAVVTSKINGQVPMVPVAKFKVASMFYQASQAMLDDERGSEIMTKITRFAFGIKSDYEANLEKKTLDWYSQENLAFENKTFSTPEEQEREAIKLVHEKQSRDEANQTLIEEHDKQEAWKRYQVRHPDVGRSDWEKEWEITGRYLSWDDFSYIWTNPAAKSVIQDLFWGSLDSSSARNIYHDWKLLREKEYLKELEYDEYHDTSEKEVLLQEFKDSWTSGVGASYFISLYQRLYSVAGPAEWLLLTGLNSVYGAIS